MKNKQLNIRNIDSKIKGVIIERINKDSKQFGFEVVRLVTNKYFEECKQKKKLEETIKEKELELEKLKRKKN